MVLKYVTKNGTRIHEPPYTQAEEDEFYRRIGGGPVTVARPASDKRPIKKAQKSVAIKRDPDPLPTAP
jgi:hypothetical protein